MLHFPQYAHFHGTEDTTAPYEGANPGGDMINNVEMYAAQWWVAQHGSIHSNFKPTMKI